MNIWSISLTKHCLDFDKLQAYNEKIDNLFKSLYMFKCGIDSNILYWHHENKILIVMFYVDDLVIMGNLEKKIT